jgi:hypothetical protein
MSNTKIYTKESLIKSLIEIANSGWIENKRHGNSGGIGNTIEDLLGIEENNLPIPNASEWELKTQRLNTSSLTTLFHLEPSPRAIRFIPNILLPHYGWRHKQAGIKYSEYEKSFRQTLNGVTHSDRGFIVKINRIDEKVDISFDHKMVSDRHKDWLINVNNEVGLNELEPQPYWGFNDLSSKAGTKLLNCFFIEAEARVNGRIEEYKYSTITMLRGFSFEKFLECIETGDILIDFDARTGHNHGTKFRIRRKAFTKLYSEVLEIIRK